MVGLIRECCPPGSSLLPPLPVANWDWLPILLRVRFPPGILRDCVLRRGWWIIPTSFRFKSGGLFLGVPFPGFGTPAPLTDSQRGTLVFPLTGQTYALCPQGLRFAWGWQLNPPCLLLGLSVCTGSSGLRVRLYSLLLWHSAGFRQSL